MKLPLQMIESQRLREDTRQVQGQRATLHLERAAQLRPLEASGEPADSRMPLPRREAPVDELRCRVERFWIGGLTGPFQLALLQGSARCHPRELVAQVRW